LSYQKCSSLLFYTIFECQKNYHISGTVTDGNFNPLAGVEVLIPPMTEPYTYTVSDGTYSFTIPHTINEHGDKLAFVKAGYTTVVAPPFTIAEAGADFCGQVHLQRDAVLQ
jgi:hypothetical protein